MGDSLHSDSLHFKLPTSERNKTDNWHTLVTNASCFCTDTLPLYFATNILRDTKAFHNCSVTVCHLIVAALSVALLSLTLGLSGLQ